VPADPSSPIPAALAHLTQTDPCELEELAADADAGAADVPGAGDQVVARLDAASRAHEGETLRLRVDTRKLHPFNPDNGAHLTL
jgi:multiple sugar transport system ATP-binding protein